MRLTKSEREELDKSRAERLQHASEKMKWMIREAKLMRVIFQLSEALEYARQHGGAGGQP
jgi:hypothetical protein